MSDIYPSHITRLAKGERHSEFKGPVAARAFNGLGGGVCPNLVTISYTNLTAATYADALGTSFISIHEKAENLTATATLRGQYFFGAISLLC